MNFTVTCTDQSSGPNSRNVKIEFSGNLENDEATLSNLAFDDQTDIQLILKDLKGINSLGVRTFINWHKGLSYKSMTIVQAPKCFIDQANMVEGFIPIRSKIKSFQVPYFSEETEQETNVTFDIGVNYYVMDQQWKFSFPQVLDKKNNPMEMDVQPERYFSFLRKLL